MIIPNHNANRISILAGDRNISIQPGSSCGYVSLTGLALLDGLGQPTWTVAPNVHFYSGNLLFNDGRARETSSAELQAALRLYGPDDIGNGGSSSHVIPPR